MTGRKTTASAVVCALSTMAAISMGEIGAQAQQKARTSAVHFEDITRAAGIHFTHNNGAFGKKWLPETMGPGVAFIDYDNDGWQDILLVNGQDWPGRVGVHKTTGASH